MTKTVFDIASVRGALARGYCALPNRHKKLDSNLIEVQAEEIMALVEACTEEQPVIVGIDPASVSDPLTPQDIRAYAYDVAVASGMGHDQSNLHQFAQQIADNVERGFLRKAEMVLKIDTAETEKLVARILREIEEQELHESIFGKTENRREGWNDCKAVMIRKITEQIADPHSDSFILQMMPAQLDDVRRFVASFQFDPAKP